MTTWWNPNYRKRAVYLYANDHNPKDIADRLLIGESSIYRWYDIFRRTGEVWTEKEAAQNNGVYVKPYPNKKLYNKQAHDTLFATLDNSSVSTLNTYREKLLNEGISASIYTIHKYFQDNDITTKKVSIFAQESDPLDVLDFWYRFHYSVPRDDMILFGDESHRNNHTCRPMWGRWEKGERCYNEDALTRGGYKLSLELFGDGNGPIVWDIIHGGVTAEEYVDFAWKQLCDVVEPYPGPHSVIIIDNCSIHHTLEWEEFVEETEILAIYLAEYCPWLNLCEWMFNGIKMKEKQKHIQGVDEAIISLNESVESMKGKNWNKVLRKLGYID